jgi:hypothetical protein
MITRHLLYFLIFIPFFLAFQVFGKLSPDEPANVLFDKPESAIYFYFTGNFREVFYPIFISSKFPIQSKFKNVFKYHVLNPEQVKQYIVSDQDLKEMILKIKDVLPSEKDASENSPDKFVVVGVMEKGKLIKMLLTQRQLEPVFLNAQNIAEKKYIDLYKSLIYFKFRAGVNTTKEELRVIFSEDKVKRILKYRKMEP